MTDIISNSLEFYEVETKYRVEGDAIYQFKQLMQEINNIKEFLYIESDDIYYTKDPNEDAEYEFIRYRFSNFKKDKRAELTIKKKIKDKNNIFRKETNLRVDNNDKAAIESFVNRLGFNFCFRISKVTHIYRLEDVTIPFYTVIDKDGKIDHFIEIEINEDNISDLTEDECWDIIRSYEQKLAPLGITAQKRLKLSLFEMYKK